MLDGPGVERGHVFHKQGQQTNGTAYMTSYTRDGFSKLKLIFVSYMGMQT